MSDTTTNTNPKTEIHFAAVINFEDDKFDPQWLQDGAELGLTIINQTTLHGLNKVSGTVIARGAEHTLNGKFQLWIAWMESAGYAHADTIVAPCFTIADKETVEAFLAKELAVMEHDVLPSGGITFDDRDIPTVREQEALWKELDQEWVNYALPLGMHGRLERAGIVYLGDAVTLSSETSFKGEIDIATENSKCVTRAKEILAAKDLVFGMDTMGWVPPHDRTSD